MIKELYFTKQSPAVATPERLATFEAEYGLRLPKAFVEFCSRWNGGFPSRENTFYHVPPRFAAFHQEYGQIGKGVSVDGLYGLTTELRGCNLEMEYLSLLTLA